MVNKALQLALVALLLLSTSAMAHQKKEAITRLVFNERTGNIEVMHRFLLHDAEHAAKRLFGGEADIINDVATQKQFGDYVRGQFSLSDRHGAELTLKDVGEETEGAFIWVYAEHPIPEGLDGLRMRHDALRELWPDQVNLVNIERNGQVSTLLFQKGAKELTTDFKPVNQPANHSGASHEKHGAHH